MNDDEPEWLLVEWLRLVQTRWAATGISRRARRDLREQLLRDLAAARAAGARVEELVAIPPFVFADSSAAGLRSRYRPISTLGLLLTCLGTGVLASGAGWIFMLVVSNLDLSTLGLPEGNFSLFIDLFVVAAVLTAMVLAARWTYRSHVDAARLTPRLAVALTVGALTGFPLASVYGAGEAYRLSLGVISVEVTIVLVFLALAVVAAQRWTRSQRRSTVRGDVVT